MISWPKTKLHVSGSRNEPINLCDCSSFNLLQGSLIVVATKLLSMKEPGTKITYSKVRLVDEGNHTRSNHEHCGDRNPSGPPTLSIHGPTQKHLKVHAATFDEWRRRKERETNSLELKQTRCGILFNGNTSEPNMFKDTI